MALDTRLLLTSQDFKQYTVSAFQRLHCDSSSADVLLVSEELGRLPAHRLVLAMASPFFASLLQESPGTQAVLYLGGLSRSHLSALISFIYLGQVEVEEGDVEQFTRMLTDFKVLGQHLKPGVVKGKVEESWDKSDLKEEQESEEEMEYTKDEDYEEQEFEEENGNEGEEVDMKEKDFAAKPKQTATVSREALIKEIMANSPVNHSQEWIENKVAKLQALTCDKCDFRARAWDRLQSHKRKYHETEWPCDQCGIVIRTEGRLKKHIRTKHDSARSKLMCDQPGCDFKGLFISQLNLHKRQEHGLFSEKHYCDQCPFSSWVSTTVRRHKEHKHEGKRHHCELCGASYPYEQGLKRHKAIAHEGKRVQCPHCEYQTTTNGNLKVHVKSKHEGLRFECDICGWSGSQENALRIHKRDKHGMSTPKPPPY